MNFESSGSIRDVHLGGFDEVRDVPEIGELEWRFSHIDVTRK